MSSTRAEEIYNQIRWDILSLHLKPGEQLEEEKLADSYDVSRTPIREALRKLERDGLITIRPHRGAYITEISLRTAIEIDEIRELLEPFAARIAASRVSQDEIDEIKRELDSLDVPNPTHDEYIGFMRLDARFHDVILQAAGNKTMQEVVTRLHHRMNAIRITSSAPRYQENIAELRHIIAALEDRDSKAAEQAMRDHIQKSRASRWRAFPEP